MADSPPRLGVNVAGFLRGALGLGEAGRLYVAALERAGVPVRTVTVEPHLSAHEAGGDAPPVAKTTDFTDLHTDVDSPFNLVCVNAPELPAFQADVGPDFFEGRRTIAVWAWEVDALPAEWRDAFELVDEVWVYSRYVEQILKPHARIPVVRVPLPVVPPEAADPRDAPDLGLGDRFTFLFMFDFFSTIARKNPLALIEAFTLAFEPGEGPQLVLKSINGDFKPERLAALERAASRQDIHVVDRYLSVAERNGLMAGCDCYVSLHRAEGFGLTMAEAMALGKPVVATGWSGNTDFMSPENSWLVDSELTEVGPEGENYPADGRWAEPDIEGAAAMMREVWEGGDEVTARAARGREDVLENLSLERVGAVAERRLYELRRAGLARPRARGRQRRRVPPEETPLRQLERNVKVDLLENARRVRGGKGAWRRLVLRVMRPYTAYQDELNRVTSEALREIADRQAGFDSFTAEMGEGETPASRGHNLAQLVTGMRARPASGHPAISFQDEVGRTVLGFDVAAEAAAPVGFEEVFRGSEELIAERQQTYADVLGAPEWVLDLGCGRGEFLALMRDRGVRARGIELNPELVTRGRERGFDVEEGDALEYLRGLDDGSVPAIFAAQVVEHLPARELRELLTLLEAKLQPDGSALLETVNPHVPSALKAFWTDPTHHHPLFPEVLIALCRFAGFATGRVLFPDASGNFDADVYECPDYAVLVTKKR